AVWGDMPDPDVLRVAEVYQNFAADLAPLITTMAISADVPLVDSAFGKVQEGSPIAFSIHYQSAELSFATWMLLLHRHCHWTTTTLSPPLSSLSAPTSSN
ncbi:hypothetical protein XENORESO_002308, partial [Xenotaenia resolanae]